MPDHQGRAAVKALHPGYRRMRFLKTRIPPVRATAGNRPRRRRTAKRPTIPQATAGT